MSRELRSRAADYRWGVRWGIGLATVYSAYVAALAILQGSTAFPTYNASLLQIVGAYYGAGIVGGALVGALRPLGSSTVGAAVIGLVASIPLWFGIGVILHGNPAHWDEDAWIAFAICVCVAGPLFGLTTKAR